MKEPYLWGLGHMDRGVWGTSPLVYCNRLLGPMEF